MIRVRFGTFSFDKITKGVKANLMEKLSHFGGTAGLFTGFSIVCVFEFFALGTGLLFNLYKFFKGRDEERHVIEVEEFRPEEMDPNRKYFDITDEAFEIIERKNRQEIELLENERKEKIQMFDTLKRKMHC